MKNETKLKRNYRFMQFLLDLFGAFQLYLVISAIVDDISRIHNTFNAQIRVANEHAEQILAVPEPLIAWGVIGLLVYLAGIIMPLIYVRKSRLNQKQFDMWVYGALAIRMLVFMIVYNLMTLHLNFIMRAPLDFRLELLMHIVLIVIIVRFTQFRIRKAQPKSEGSMTYTFTED